MADVTDRRRITGFFLDIPDLGGRHLRFLAEVIPRLQRIAVLWDAELASSQFKASENGAREGTARG